LREQEMLTTLIDLGRQVAAVLDVDELVAQIPNLSARLIQFDAFAVYLLDERRGDLRIAYSIGYPDEQQARRLTPDQGLVGAALTTHLTLLLTEVRADPRYDARVP